MPQLFQIMLGKCKPIPPSSSSDVMMDPTPNYDCHVPQSVARPSDTIGTQTARSQVHLVSVFYFNFMKML